MKFHGNWSIVYNDYYRVFHHNIFFIDDEFKVIHSNNLKATFVYFAIQVVLSQFKQNHLHMLCVLFIINWINENAISINKNKNVQVISESFINMILKYNKCINQFKWNYFIFEMFVFGFERCFLFIIFFWCGSCYWFDLIYFIHRFDINLRLVHAEEL